MAGRRGHVSPHGHGGRGPDSGPARDTTPARSARLKSGPQGQRLVSTLPRLYPLPLALLKNAWVPAYLVYKLYTPVAHVRGGSPAYEGPMKDSAKMTTRAPGVAWCLHQRTTMSRIYLRENSSAQFRLVSTRFQRSRVMNTWHLALRADSATLTFAATLACAATLTCSATLACAANLTCAAALTCTPKL